MSDSQKNGTKVEGSDYQDIITYEPETLMIIKDPELRKYFIDDAYFAIFVVLREGPLTVKEITKKYNKYVLDKLLREKRVSEDEIEKYTRSEKSIYRYLKDLVNSGLVVLAGKRVKLSQTATETLYARKAKIFFLGEDYNYWNTPKAQPALKVLSEFIDMLKNVKPPIENIAKLLQIIEEETERQIFEIFEEQKKKIGELIKDLSLEDVRSLLHEMKLITLLFNCSEFQEILEQYLN